MARKFLLPLIGLLMSMLSCRHLQAQLIINEFMASNSGVIVDPDYKESADWLEIYNAGSGPVQLKGYYITDNFSDLTKWQINANVEIASHQYLIIWADGMDNGLHTSFKLSASGEELAIVSPTKVIVDSVSFGVQDVNISMGRRDPASSEWVFFTNPTPGSPNSSSSFSDIVYSSPDFSVRGGIYRSAVQLQVSTLFGGVVRYTLDGSEPNANSPVASSPFTITKNTVVRARIFKEGELPGPVATNSYFIDPGNEHGTLPIVSIASAPENFWDEEKGIYVQDFKPDWEVPVNVELFENDGSDRAAFNLQAGIKVNGLYSWKSPQKMLGVYFRKEYGAGKLDYPIIFDKARKTYDNFALRASGSDWSNTLFRDGMIQNSTMGYTNLDNSGFRACVVFVNGEYLGIHNIREKIDEDYIVGNHGLKGGTFDMVEETDNGRVPETGDAVAYNHLFDLAARDLTNPSNWDSIANFIDKENFTDFVCTEVFAGNSSINHNVMAWKPKGQGKWKWIIMDLDRGFFDVNGHLINFSLSQDAWPFSQLMHNADYKKYFGRRLADHLFTTFNPQRIIPIIDKHTSEIEAEIPYHVNRWKGSVAIGAYTTPIPSFDYWLGEVEELRTFAQARPDVLLDNLTQYGFQDAVPVSVSVFPSRSGHVTFNGLKIPVDQCRGAYPEGEEIRLVATSKAGYNFLGWKPNAISTVISRGSEWKYSDVGQLASETAWRGTGFDDTLWKNGKAELGYGDGDETTVIGYGSSSSNKYITSYFRKQFAVDDKEKIFGMVLHLKCDDGAVVYLNGHEVVRFNMPAGNVVFGTTAVSAVDDETSFRTFTVDPAFLVNGKNVIAVEVHQSSGSSSDVSFDLDLEANMIASGAYLSTSNEWVVTTPAEGIDVSAVFESDGKCLVPAEITDVVTLNKECSPYLVPENVTITNAGKLTIEPGVEVWFSDGVSVFASGAIMAKGTAADPIVFRENPNENNAVWGAICLRNVSDTSHFSNVIIEGASKGPHPVREIAAVSCFHSVAVFDSVVITDVEANPIVGRYSDIRLTNSTIHSKVTGDGINVKYGKGFINHCEFTGNDQVDSDGIDYDNVAEGTIKNTIIHDFYGDNSDAIDIGEATSDLSIDSMFVYNIRDKGTSVGQRSSATVTNSVFVNCNMGAGLKDSSRVNIDHCTYYGNNVGVAVYEKNAGDAGANVVVKNTLLSNSYTAAYSCDEFSTIHTSYSASDNEKLPDGWQNVAVNPLFKNPVQFDFSYAENSPCRAAGSDGDMGFQQKMEGIKPQLMISAIAYLTDLGAEDLEFIGIYNPGSSRVDLSGYSFTKGITYTFPDGISIGPGETFYVTSRIASSFWNSRGAVVFQWTSGRLADEGEAIQLVDQFGMIVDQVVYNNKSPWPVPPNAEWGIQLSRYDVDNHFGEYWKLLTTDEIVSARELTNRGSFRVYPNPSSGTITFSGVNGGGQVATVFNLQGRKVKNMNLEEGQNTLDLSELSDGIYLISLGGKYSKIALRK